MFTKGKVRLTHVSAQRVFLANVSVQTGLDVFITLALIKLLQHHRDEFIYR